MSISAIESSTMMRTGLTQGSLLELLELGTIELLSWLGNVHP